MCRFVSEGGVEPGGPVLPGRAAGQAGTLRILSHALCQVICDITKSIYICHVSKLMFTKIVRIDRQNNTYSYFIYIEITFNLYFRVTLLQNYIPEIDPKAKKS